MLKRLAPAGLAVLGLVALVLAMPSFGAASAQTTVKPKYRLRVSVSGVPSKIVLDQQYTYVIKVVNTGRLKIKKITVCYWDGRFVQKPYPSGCKYITGATANEEAEVRCTLTNVRAGATKRITFGVVYNRPNEAVAGSNSTAHVLVAGSPGGRAEKRILVWY